MNFLLSPFFYSGYFKRYFNIVDGASKNLKTITVNKKMNFLFDLSEHLHQDYNINKLRINNFYAAAYSRVSPLRHFNPWNGIRRYNNRIQ